MTTDSIFVFAPSFSPATDLALASLTTQFRARTYLLAEEQRGEEQSGYSYNQSGMSAHKFDRSPIITRHHCHQRGISKIYINYL